jgi:hypothetical protein
MTTEQTTTARPQTVCKPSQPLIGLGSRFQYRSAVSTDIRATFARIREQTEAAMAQQAAKT